MISPKEEAKGEYYLDIYDVQDILAAIPDFPGPRITVKSAKGGGGGRGGGQGAFQFDDDDAGRSPAPSSSPRSSRRSSRTRPATTKSGATPPSYELHRGQIIVNQTKDVHENIKRVLKNLRVNVGLFVQVEARFILIYNDFLQDIGVDYRGLGALGPGRDAAPADLG